MLFATEYEYMAYTGLTIGIEQDLGHQATCFHKLGRRRSSLRLVEDYQRSPQEHQAGCQVRQPGVLWLLHHWKLFSTNLKTMLISLLLWFIRTNKNFRINQLRNSLIWYFIFTFIWKLLSWHLKQLLVWWLCSKHNIAVARHHTGLHEDIQGYRAARNS